MVNIHHASAAPSDLRLIAQNFNVASDRQFRFVFNVSDEQLREQLGESNTATITVRAYPTVSTTAELSTALDSPPGTEPIAVFGALAWYGKHLVLDGDDAHSVHGDYKCDASFWRQFHNMNTDD